MVQRGIELFERRLLAFVRLFRRIGRHGVSLLVRANSSAARVGSDVRSGAAHFLYTCEACASTAGRPLLDSTSVERGKQAGDPGKAAQARLKVIAAENPPVHLLLGNDALRLVRDKLSALSDEIEAWQEVSASTDFS